MGWGFEEWGPVRLAYVGRCSVPVAMAASKLPAGAQPPATPLQLPHLVLSTNVQLAIAAF
jgi:hypothetical protein